MKFYFILLWYFEFSLSLKCHRCPIEGKYILREPYPACFINSSDTGYVQNCDPWLKKCATEIIRKSFLIYFSIVFHSVLKYLKIVSYTCNIAAYERSELLLFSANFRAKNVYFNLFLARKFKYLKNSNETFSVNFKHC